MPFKAKPRYTKRKRFVKRYRRRRAIGQPSRRKFFPNIYKFKRALAPQIVRLSEASKPDDWTYDNTAGSQGMYHTQKFAFNQLPAGSRGDFTNLFKMYKLYGVKLRLWVSSNIVPNVISSSTSGASFSVNSTQMILSIQRNTTGSGLAMTAPYVAEAIANVKKYYLTTDRAKPLSLWIKPLEITSNESITKARWHPLTTLGESEQSFGFNIRISRVDGQALTTDIAGVLGQCIRMEYVYYFATRQVE